MRFFHPITDLAAAKQTVRAIPLVDSPQFVRRLIAAYHHGLKDFASGGDSMWQDFFDQKHGDVHKALINKDVETVTAILQQPHLSDVFFGFDAVSKSDLAATFGGPSDVYCSEMTLDTLLRLAHAVGARRIFNPERMAAALSDPAAEADRLLALLDERFGFTIDLQNLFSLEAGIGSSRGVVSWRIPQSLYQAWRIAELVKHIDKPRVLEIGGGLGRTAYYARQFGVVDYSIVDIPVTALAQGYFLGHVLHYDHVVLSGEAASETDQSVKLLSPSTFHDSTGHYDLIVNIDSLTEMDRNLAEQYLTTISNCCDVFVSINHEANNFTVRDLMQQKFPDVTVSRNPYWLRHGYIDEVAVFGAKSGAS